VVDQHDDAGVVPSMKVVLTGGAGFVGGAIARNLRERGDDIVALVRDPARAGRLTRIGAQVVANDLSDATSIAAALAGADALIHAAGSYRVGITKKERPQMWDANVGTTTRVLDAAAAAGTKRIVYVSSVNIFGNTHRRVVDETYRRNLVAGFVSYYDETKFQAHEVAEGRMAGGAPIVIVLPSQVYGPGDHSSFGEQLAAAYAGKLPYRAFEDVGVGLVHVDDLAAGIVAALDSGDVGRSYILSGPTTTLGEAVALAAKVDSREPPRLSIPTGLLRVFAPLGALIGQPNLREVISASSGVTYWGTAARAEQELGFHARPIEDGLRDTFTAA
jgi:nucleoside-diphosphate-sugar epimerase